MFVQYKCGVVPGRYDANGNSKGEVAVKPPAPSRLQWDLTSDEYKEAAQMSYTVAKKLVSDLDLRIVMYSGYGKG